MQKYHVYGIGNALVDVEVNVEDQFLSANKVDKGLMTLVEHERQEELMHELSQTPLKRACGGSAANTIIAVSQLGGSTFYSCKVANDEPGDFYYKDLVSLGVDTNLRGQRGPGVTGKCLVMITPDAERTMNTYLGITATYGEDQIEYDAMKLADYLYVEGYLVASETAREAAIKAADFARANQIKVALTFSDPNMVNFFKEGLNQMIGPGVDLLFCNEIEATSWAETEDLDAAIEKLKTVAKEFVVTLGSKGALVFDGQNLLEIPAQSVDPLDSNGAGDMFAGAYLFGKTHGYDCYQAGLLASQCSGKLVTQYGPRLDKQTVKTIKGEFEQTHLNS